jgi:small subunit ribosomal protein S15
MVKVKEDKKKKAVKPASAKASAGKSVKPVKKEVKVKVKKVVEAPKSTLEDDKQKIIDKFGQKKGDTGSPEVQVALLSLKIDKLAEHLEINKKDNHSRRGLLKVIAKRRRILNYLEKLDEKRYKKLIKEIGLKK